VNKDCSECGFDPDTCLCDPETPIPEGIAEWFVMAYQEIAGKWHCYHTMPVGSYQEAVDRVRELKGSISRSNLLVITQRISVVKAD